MSKFGHTDAALDEGQVETTDVDEAIHANATVDILPEDEKSICEQETALKDDMQRIFTKLKQKSFLAAYCNINPSV